MLEPGKGYQMHELSTGRKFVLCNVNVALVKHSELLFFMWSETVVHNTPNSELPWGLSLTLFALFVIFIVNFEMSIGFKWPRQQQNRRKFQKQWDFFNFNKHVSKVHQSSSVWRLWKFTADKTCLLQCIVSVTLRWKTIRYINFKLRKSIDARALVYRKSVRLMWLTCWLRSGFSHLYYYSIGFIFIFQCTVSARQSL